MTTPDASPTPTDLVLQGLRDALPYDDYVDLLRSAAEGGAPLYETEKRNFFTRLNHQRMKRLDATVRLLDEVVAAGEEIRCRLAMLVLTEGWCGDAAQVVPVLNLLARRFDTLELGLLFRDRHPELMDAFLTRGARSIPKVILVDLDARRVRGSWGPRPRPAQDLFEVYRDGGAGIDYETFQRELQKWYLRDRAEHIQREIVEMLVSCRVDDSEARSPSSSA